MIDVVKYKQIESEGIMGNLFIRSNRSREIKLEF